MSKHVLALGELNAMEHICPKCVNHGSIHCPNNALAGEEKGSDFSQLIEYIETPVKIIVINCKWFKSKEKVKEEAREQGLLPRVKKKTNFVFNRRTHHFEPEK